MSCTDSIRGLSAAGRIFARVYASDYTGRSHVAVGWLRSDGRRRYPPAFDRELTACEQAGLSAGERLRFGSFVFQLADDCPLGSTIPAVLVRIGSEVL